MKYDVFISYKSQSINVVKAIAHVLENENIRCWYAPRDLDNQAAGKDYDDKIAEAITNCSILVVVLSNAALTSEWVKAEVGMAQKQKKLVIPYVVSELQVENGLRMRLESKHWIDAYPNPERKFSILLKNVKIFLNNEATEKDEANSETRFVIEDIEDNSVDFDYEEGLALLEAKEYNDAALAFMASAERGNKNAKDMLCQMFYDIEEGEDLIQNEIWDNIERQAKEGHCYANFLLHCRVYKDASSNLVSFEYLKKSIKCNTIGLAFLRMGIQYNWGMGVKQSHTLGMHYYNKAYALGCKEAFSYMGQEYRHGSDKILKDENKAVELLTKGIEAGDNRSFTQLVYYFLYDKHDKEKAIDMAKKAIQSGYLKGYSLMGTIYLGDGDTIEQNQDEAAKWFKEGLRHDDKSAYGALALLYYNQGEYDHAFDMARRGRYAHDSDSIYMLGLLYEREDKYDEAWQCYSEQYDRFGIGADNMAHLVMDSGYRPENMSDDNYKQMLDELEQKLEILARNYNQNCLEALIKFYSFRAGGVATLDYDIVKSVPKALDFIKLGAEMGIPEMMFYIGNTIINDKDNEKVNPYKGLEWLEKAAKTNHEDSIKCLMDLYGSYGRFHDDDEFKKLVVQERTSALNGDNTALNILLDVDRFKRLPKDCDFAPLISQCISRKYYSSKILPTLLNQADTSSRETKTVFCQFLSQAINNTLHDIFLSDLILDIPTTFSVYERLYTVAEECGFDISDEIKQYMRSMVNEQIAKNNLGYFRKFGTSKVFSDMFSDYNVTATFRDFSGACMENKRLFYAQYYANEYEIDVEQQDEFAEKMFSCIDIDYSLMEKRENYDTNVNELIHAMETFDECYHKVCEKQGIMPKDYHLPKREFQFPFMPTSVCCKIGFDTFSLFLSLYNVLPDIYEPVLPILWSDEKMLNYIESLTGNSDLQLFFISLVEIRIDIESIMIDNSMQYKKFKDYNLESIASRMNSLVRQYGSQSHRTEDEVTFTIENLPDFSKIVPNRILKSEDFYDTEAHEDNKVMPRGINKQEEKDDFDRLLDDFINSSLKEDDSQE